jgi:CTP:molybdopterin cytidylyltransferase MocA
MGEQKLSLPCQGKLLLAWTLELVESLPLERRLIVLGAQADEILESLFSLPLDGGGLGKGWTIPNVSRATRHGKEWHVIYNLDWRRGMGSSLRRAAEVVDGGTLVFLGDMPWVPEWAARAVLSRAGDRPVAPSYRGRRGFPVYLPASLRPKLLELSGDIGARELIKDGCELIPCDDPGVVWDVDFEEDLSPSSQLKCCPSVWKVTRDAQDWAG